jgi:hypothetical protein
MQPDSNPQPIVPPEPVSPQSPEQPQRRMPSYRAIRVFVLLGLIVIVMGWIGISKLVHHTVKSTPTTQRFVKSSIQNVCSNGSRLQAEPYKEGTVQPMALYARSGIAADTYQGIYVLGVAPLNTPLQHAYTVVGKNLNSTFSSGKAPVVVGCITRSNEVKTAKNCTYEDTGKVIPVYHPDYTLTVYEAATHRVLRRVAIPTQAIFTCHSYVTYDGKGFYHMWDTATVAEQLQSFAE